MTLHLLRHRPQGQAVTGRITLPFDAQPLTYPTLENADFLIPEGTYPLRMTWSPRFRKMMPEICEVPDRDGIRIHAGSRPEHSAGCVLMSPEGIANTKIFINAFNKWYDNEPLYLCIRTEQDPL